MDIKEGDMIDRGASASGVVVQVREKKGPLRAAIPYMPFPVAVICLFLNTFVPGLGTFVSAFTVLCGARTDLPDRHVCCVFWLNIAAALIQILTAIVMVGWIMSIFWGMDMVILAISQGGFHLKTRPEVSKVYVTCYALYAHIYTATKTKASLNNCNNNRTFTRWIPSVGLGFEADVYTSRPPYQACRRHDGVRWTKTI
ncbi:protein stum homolog [Spea bombifrons]|uniref:protein stum homolog n=1 Tax=Spea bombifrons TaxID=233779 RepID=UPI00234AC2AB|nr:protein stum homolog [Spea bombifrons]